MKKLLFISHAASRSGAPFVLLYLLQWLKEHTNFSFDVMLLHDGPLKQDFELVAEKVYVLPELLYNNTLLYKIRRKLKLVATDEIQLKTTFKKMGVNNYDVIYGNTIVCLPLLLTLKGMIAAKTIIAIHELTTSIETFHTAQYVKEGIAKIDCVIAGSQAVSDNLQKRYHVPPTLLCVVHAFIHTANLPKSTTDVLGNAGVPANRFIIGGAGTPEWRKGMDLIVPLGMYFKKQFPDFDFHIVWVGGTKNDHFVRHLLVDIEKTGLSANITLVENTKDYLEFIQSYDVFLMLSREDPFPLVSIEAAYLQKPILMFSGAGGTQEIIQTGGGIAVPYMDIESLATEIITLSKDSSLRKHMGKLLCTEVLSQYSSDIACKKVHSILNSFT